MAALRRLTDPQAVALVLLHSVAAAGAGVRALTLVVRGTDLIAERGIGCAEGPARQPLQLTGPALTLPIGAAGPLGAALDADRCLLVPADDPALAPLVARIGRPRHPTALLLPLRAAGKVVSLTYADFGQADPAPLDVDLLDVLAAHAGVVLESIVYRRRAQKPPAAAGPHNEPTN